MASIFHVIDHYKVWYYGKNDHRIQIQVYQKDEYVGSLTFTDQSEIPSNEVIDGQLIRLSFHTGEYGHVIDLLRNESPLFIWINETSGIGGLATDELEPIGEGEN